MFSFKIFSKQQLILSYLHCLNSFRQLSHYDWKLSHQSTLIKRPITTKHDFKNIGKNFYSRWGLPHCLGAIDVRSIKIKRPRKSGSKYFNYKKFFLIAFQAVVGPNRKYICIDVGGYGRQRDSIAFFSSKFYAALKKKLIQLPNDSLLPDSSLVLPFFLLAMGLTRLWNTWWNHFREKI